MTDSGEITILFLLPVPTHFRYRKRIAGLRALGVVPMIYAFDRDYYSAGEYSLTYVSLGEIAHGSFVSRLLPLWGAARQVGRNARRAKVMYAFGLDMLAVAWIARLLSRSHATLVYEVGDVDKILLTAGPMSKALRAAERFLARRCRLIVSTSRAFVDEYFRRRQGLDNVEFMVIENKLQPDAVASSPAGARSGRLLSRRVNEPFTIGYFGLLRCERTWRILLDAARGGQGRVRVIMRGVPLVGDALIEEADRTPFVYRFGTYEAPSDLSAMYAEVDLVWACFPCRDADGGHWRWARTNRFYEGCYFGKPLAVRCGSEDAADVSKWGIGLCVDPVDVDATRQAVLAITQDDLALWRRRVLGLPAAVFTYTDEHRRLRDALGGAAL